jgi:hypothetical protein
MKCYPSLRKGSSIQAKVARRSLGEGGLSLIITRATVGKPTFAKGTRIRALADKIVSAAAKSDDQGTETRLSLA